MAFYTFDDAGAPLADSSGNGYDLTGPAGTNPSWGATHGFGGSGAYDFSGDRLIAPIDINPTAMPRMTWGAWVRTDSLSSERRKVLGHDNGGWDRTIGLDNRYPSTLRYTSFTGNDPVNNSGPVEGTPGPVNTTDWTFIAAAYDQVANTVTMYVDLDASTTDDALVAVTEPGAFGPGWSTFAIGGIRPDNGNEPWDGVIDNVFLYDEVLDEAAVTAVRDAPGDPRAPTIHAFRAVPGHISAGETTTLSWETEGADTLSIDRGVPPISGDTGTVVVSPSVTTTYSLTATKDGGSVTSRVTVGVNVIPLAPRITEFMASNSDTLDDGDGVSSDWIEIYNPNPFAINLAGYVLRDAVEDWVFPDVQVEGEAFLIVFASGQDQPDHVDAGGYLHTTFKLSASGEDLALLDRDGQTVLQAFTDLPEQRTDVSWGVDPSTAGQGFFVPPTPGSANGTALEGFVADTGFDVDRGFYDTPFTVTITSTTPGASVAYTTDGSEPSPTNGIVVAAPGPGVSPAATVSIPSTTTLRAMAFRDGWVPANVDTHTYIFLAHVIDQPTAPPGLPATWGEYTGVNGFTAGTPVPADYEMNPAIVNADRPGMIAALESLPSLSIVADPADIFGTEGILANPFASIDGTGVHTQTPFETDRRCSVEWIQPDGARELQIDCAVRLVGGWSRHYAAAPKKSLRLNFRQEYGAGKLEFPLFGEHEIDTFDRLHLRATFSDGWVDSAVPAQFLRDPFVRETYLAMGQPGSRGTFVHLYINGLYWGIYNPTERPDGSYAAGHYGGDDSDYDGLKHAGLFSATQEPPSDQYEVIDGTATRWVEALSASAADLGVADSYALFQQYVNVVCLADYIIVNTFLANQDWPNKNWYAFGRRDGSDGGFRFSPWDAEYTLHNLDLNKVNVSAIRTPPRFYDRARSNAEFRLMFADRVHRHAFNDGPLTAAAMTARYTAMAAALEPAIDAEAARWGDNPNTRRGTCDYRKSDWIAARDTILTNVFPNRPAIALQQYRVAGLYPSIDAPEFTQHGGALDPPRVTFTDLPDGTIYVTTDGSDPRREGGAVNPAGHTPNSNGVVLARSSTVKARLRSPAGEWSALTEAFFTVAAEAAASNTLVVSELNYNPYPPRTPAELAIPGVSNEDFEFVELIGAHPANDIFLSGARFVQGIDFTFGDVVLAPGECTVLVRNREAFGARYGTNVHVAGEYIGGLDNAGETLTLVDATGAEVLSFTYGDSGLWPPLADGPGATLQLVHPTNTAAMLIRKSYAWQSSTFRGGTPGSLVPGSEPTTGIVINEVLTHTDPPQTDAIELFNPTGDDVDIGGWFLSDSPGQPLKFEIPSNTWLAAGGYLVFDEDDFNPTPLAPGTNHFALDGARGDEVCLTVPTVDGAAAMAFVDHVAFGATFNGESLGRYPNGHGGLTPMSQLTLGGPNAPPRFGPMLVSEVNYHPGSPSAAALAVDPTLGPGDLEFVEICNRGEVAIGLADWRLRGEGDYDFAGGTNLNAGQVLVVIGFDPGAPANATRLAAFRAHYGVGEDIAVVGGLSGRLDNSEGRVRLERPDEPPVDDPGFTPHITEDELTYDDLFPWPAMADGLGDSLNRALPGRYGNDVASWYVSQPTPGTVGLAPTAVELCVVLPEGVGENELTLRWPSEPGRHYEIATSTNLALGTWTTVEADLPSGGAVTSYTHRSVARKCFVRIRRTP